MTLAGNLTLIFKHSGQGLIIHAAPINESVLHNPLQNALLQFLLMLSIQQWILLGTEKLKMYQQQLSFAVAVFIPSALNLKTCHCLVPIDYPYLSPATGGNIDSQII